jgi:hypothetical protein
VPGRGNQSVFLNVPFDRAYEPLFIALVGGLVGLGRTPRCVLELPPSARRLDRIFALLRSCRVSVHDLSRVTLTDRPFRAPRFNMPFELGLACAVGQSGWEHRFFVFEEKQYRLSVSLSDLNGYDPVIHGGTRRGILGALLTSFGARSSPELADLVRLTNRLGIVARELKRRHGAPLIFDRQLFRLLVTAAVTISRASGLIAG